MSADSLAATWMPPPKRPRRTPFRSDIQALRALAVSLVVLNHLWPSRVTGGYVGVDVFFVISGFLITAHLGKELIGTSRIDLARFYARRIKRLLPAAFLVLAVGSVAVAFWVPYSEWARTGREVLSSALYMGNWSLAAQSVDYSALTNEATVAQHYWSLSVEEQFYFLWPWALFGLYRLGSRLRSPRALLIIGVGAIAVVSLLFSISFTASNPNPAYFVTPSRVWEFAVGALLALAASRIRFSPVSGLLVAVLGWLAILYSAYSFDTQTAFPGTAAMVPVLGTAAVIAAGIGQRTAPLQGLVGARPVKFIGDISYSIYLWHWPMIVVAPYVLGSELWFWQKVGLLALCLPLAWATKTFVEDAGKSWRILGRSPHETFASMAMGIFILGIISGGMMLGANFKAAEADSLAANSALDSCHGPGSLPARKTCADALGPALVTVMGDKNKYYAGSPECKVDPDRKGDGGVAVAVCDFSAGNPGATTAWLVGDSHAEQWKLPLLDLAKTHGWKLTYALMGGCPVADVPFVSYEGKSNPSAASACKTGGKSIASLIEQDKPDRVFYSIFSRQETLDDGTGRSQEALYAEGLPKFWIRWVAAGSTVYVLADPPLNAHVRDSKCVVLNPNEPLKCAVDRSLAQPRDPMVIAATKTPSKNVHLIDLTDHFCDSQKCYSVVGNVAVYYDANHLNAEFSRLLAPYIERMIGL